MKSIILKNYYYILMGSFGGLLTWYFNYKVIKLWDNDSLANYIILGAFWGIVLGFLFSFIEFILARYHERFLRATIFGILLGGFFGAFGFLVLASIYKLLPNSAGSIRGTLGLTIFGGLLGSSYGILGDTQIGKAALGGAIGGFLGGLIFATFPKSLSFTSLAPLFAVGSCIGLALSIAASLQDAWLEIKGKGDWQARRFDLSKGIRNPGKTMIIGRGKGSHYSLSDDIKVQPKHASITREGEYFIFREMEGNVYVNQRPVKTHKLKDGDLIAIANSTLVYHEKRGKKAKKENIEIRKKPIL